MFDELNQFVSSGRAIDLILLVLLIEAVALAAIYGASWKRSFNIAAAALPGICLLMALRASLTGAELHIIALWLVLSFPAHLFDLWRRPP